MSGQDAARRKEQPSERRLVSYVFLSLCLALHPWYSYAKDLTPLSIGPQAPCPVVPWCPAGSGIPTCKSTMDIVWSLLVFACLTEFPYLCISGPR